MVRRVALASLLAATTAVAVAVAQQPVTVVTTDGERISGHLTYRVENRVGSVGLSGPPEYWFPIEQIAIISFVQGDPGADEVRQLPESNVLPALERHRFVTRDGSIVAATLDYINPNGHEVTYDGPMGRRVVPSSSLTRIYLNPRAGRSLYSRLLEEGGQSGSVDRTITVPANRGWTDTGLTVRRGDSLAFRARGEVRLGPDLVGNPDGVPGALPERGTVRDRFRGQTGGAPVADAQLGTLIGRVGSGRPFRIGSHDQPIPMPDSGRLMLGVNAATFDGNSGSFTVDISRR